MHTAQVALLALFMVLTLAWVVHLGMAEQGKQNAARFEFIEAELVAWTHVTEFSPRSGMWISRPVHSAVQKQQLSPVHQAEFFPADSPGNATGRIAAYGTRPSFWPYLQPQPAALAADNFRLCGLAPFTTAAHEENTTAFALGSVHCFAGSHPGIATELLMQPYSDSSALTFRVASNALSEPSVVVPLTRNTTVLVLYNAHEDLAVTVTIPAALLASLALPTPDASVTLQEDQRLAGLPAEWVIKSLQAFSRECFKTSAFIASVRRTKSKSTRAAIVSLRTHRVIASRAVLSWPAEAAETARVLHGHKATQPVHTKTSDTSHDISMHLAQLKFNSLDPQKQRQMSDHPGHLQAAMISASATGGMSGSSVVALHVDRGRVQQILVGVVMAHYEGVPGHTLVATLHDNSTCRAAREAAAAMEALVPNADLCTNGVFAFTFETAR